MSCLNLETQTKNTLRVSISFLLLFYAVLSTEFIFQPLIESFSRRGYNVQRDDGYTCLAITYFVSTIACFFVSPLVNIISSKWAMVMGMSTNWMAQFVVLFMDRYLLYAVMVLLGCGTVLCWVGQGQYITDNCTDKTREKNTSLQWGFFKISLIFGGITFFLYFQNTTVDDEVESGKINYFIIFMLIITTLAILNTAFLPTLKKSDRPQKTYKQAVMEIWELLKTRRTLLLCTVYMFLGVSRAFWVSIFPAVIKFSSLIGENTSKMFALTMTSTGVGQVFGAFLLTWLGVGARKLGRNNIVIFALLVQIVVMILICCGFPNDAVKKRSEGVGLLFTPNIFIAIFCSTFLGFVDAVIHTQVYSYIADFYKEKSSAAFAIFRCFCGITTVLLFIVAKFCGLYIILLLCSVMTIMCAVCVYFIRPTPQLGSQ